MATDNKQHLPTSDFPAEETQRNKESQQLDETQNDIFYKVKTIPFFGGAKTIILQDKNGPCPLVAICNVLVLRNDINLEPENVEVSQTTLIGLLNKTLISNSNLDINDEECSKNQTLSDAMELLPRLALANGIRVYPNIMRIFDFEPSSALDLFSLLNIPLCHGSIVEPKDLETAKGIGSKSYSGLTTETHTVKAQSSSGECFIDYVPLSESEGKSILRQGSSERKDTNGLTPGEGEAIKTFMENDASQLTRHGLFCLEQHLQEGGICILLRNNQFYTMLKHDDRLYTLFTDQGCLMEQDVVWKSLNQFDGDSVFMTGNFEVFNSSANQLIGDDFMTGNLEVFNSSSNEDTDIEVVNSSSSEDTIERVVTLHAVCPKSKVGVLRGRQQSTITNIRSQTHARVSINPDAGYELVTLSAVETLRGESPSTTALVEIIPLIREFKQGMYHISLIVEEPHQICLREDLLAEWMQQTLTIIRFSQHKKRTIVHISGGNHALRNVVSLLVTTLRKTFFN